MNLFPEYNGTREVRCGFYVPSVNREAVEKASKRSIYNIGDQRNDLTGGDTCKMSVPSTGPRL